MAPKTALICNTCGHFIYNHSSMMGCMVQGECNYKQTHYCECEKFEEIIYDARGKDNEVAGPTLRGEPAECRSDGDPHSVVLLENAPDGETNS